MKVARSERVASALKLAPPRSCSSGNSWPPSRFRPGASTTSITRVSRRCGRTARLFWASFLNCEPRLFTWTLHRSSIRSQKVDRQTLLSWPLGFDLPSISTVHQMSTMRLRANCPQRPICLVNQMDPPCCQSLARAPCYRRTRLPSSSSSSASWKRRAHSSLVTASNVRSDGSCLQINAFYLQKEAEMKDRMRALIDKRKTIQAHLAGKLSKDSASFIALHEGLRYFERDLSKLQVC